MLCISRWPEPTKLPVRQVFFIKGTSAATICQENNRSFGKTPEFPAKLKDVGGVAAARSNIGFGEFAPNGDGDSPVLPGLFAQISEGEEIGTVTADRGCVEKMQQPIRTLPPCASENTTCL